MLLLLPSAAFAFDATHRPTRIGILRPVDEYFVGRESSVQDLVLRSLAAELRQRGFDAYESDMTIDDVEKGSADADFLVEVAGGDAYSDDYGGIGVGNRNADVTLAVVASRVAGQLRIYDGQTLELLAKEEISRRSSAILPTSIGLGGHELFAVVALPFVQWAQVRRVAHAASRDAADIVTTTLRGQ